MVQTLALHTGVRPLRRVYSAVRNDAHADYPNRALLYISEGHFISLGLVCSWELACSMPCSTGSC